MKNNLIFCIIINVFFCLSCNTQQKNELTNLKGEYLGQEKPGLVPVIFAPNIVSTEITELCNAFSPDGTEFYYTARVNNRNTIMYTKQINEIWTKPKIAEFSGEYADVDPYFSADGSKLYFSSQRPINKNTKSKDSDIWYVERSNKKGWQAPKEVENVNTEDNDEYYTSISENGTLYFSVFESHGSVGNIFKSKLTNSIYSKPELIKYPISSSFSEHDPYIAPDESYMIFTSTREGGFGKEDLYISFSKHDNIWDTPINMGKTINTDGYEFCPMVSFDKRFLFFTRNTNGNGDIYWVDARIIENLKLMSANKNQLIKN